MGRPPLSGLVLIGKVPARFATVACVTMAYLAAARLGFAIGPAAEPLPLVSPAPGLGLALLLMWGVEVWPGMLAGALIANAISHQPPLVALAIAAGQTLAAVGAVRLIGRFAAVGVTLDTIRQTVALVLFGVVGATIVSGTVAAVALCLGGIAPWIAFSRLWWTGSLAAATGELLILPALLTWRTWRDPTPRQIREAGSAAIALALISTMVFVRPFADPLARLPLEYLVFPLLIWAAARFGIAGASGANIVMASIAIWGTARGAAPYAPADLAERLILVHIYVLVAGGTGLLLGAAMSERSAALKRRNAEHAVTRVLADAVGADEATRRIIDVVNADLGWDVGLWWSVDPEAGRLRCAEIRSGSAASFPAFGEISRSQTFGPGEWLPGHVWAYAAPQWIPDVVNEPRSARLRAAAAEGLHGAFAFPISVGNEVVGVFEFCSRRIRQPDEDLLWMFTAIGAQVGQFVARQRMEDQVRESEARKAGMLNAALDCVITADQDGRILEFNPAAERTFGFRAAEIIGQCAIDVLIPAAERTRCLGQLECYRSAADGVVGRRLEIVAMRVDGTRFSAEVSMTRISSPRGPLFTGFLRDITRQKRRARQLAFRATHDGLTKLLNRFAFMDRLKQAMVHAGEVGGSVAVFFIDLDRFKALNGSLGHLAGDRLLVETARRLRRCVRPGDVVARFGGDEFAVLLERVIDVDAVSAMAERVRREFDRPFTAGGRAVMLSASVGVAINQRNDDRPDDLLRAADAAMYRVKAGSRVGRARASR